jgi:Zn-dependent peptidase ImmA (M78 family)
MIAKNDLTVVKKYWYTAPVDVHAIARELGLGPSAENLPKNVSGLIRRRNGGYEIAYNAAHSEVRQRFTIAHEIGHYVFHRDLLGKGVGDTLAYRDDGSGLPNPHISIREEREANAFAANVLMPTHLIQKLRSEGITEPVRLAARLNVSLPAIRIKLGLSVEPDLFSLAGAG